MKAIIIGAGVGGMASAARLSRLGINIEIFEKRSKVGGRLSNYEEKGFRIDRGPTLLLMPDVFEGFFTDIGKDIKDYLELTELDPVYRLHFDDGSIIEPSISRNNMISTISKINKEDSKNYCSFISDYQKYYDIALKEFIMKNFDSPFQMLTPAGISSLLSGGALTDLYSKTGDYFKDPRVRIAFSIQSIYIGERPDKTPSVYGLIPFVEYTQGVWYPKGGLYSVADALLNICREMNVQVHLEKPVKKIIIENGTAIGVEFEDGKKEYSDIIISDVDLPYTYTRMIDEIHRPHMKDSKIESLATSCSAFMIYLGVKGTYDIAHHNFILATDFNSTLDDIFKNKKIPEKPGIYIANPSSHDPTLAPEGHSIIYILVPVPNLSGAIDWSKETKAFREMIIDKLALLGMDDIRERIVFEKIITPEEWKKEYNLEKGATFGLSPILLQSAAFRPPNKDQKIKNLYFVGASTHPGSGVPIVLLSSKLLEMRIRDDFGV